MPNDSIVGACTAAHAFILTCFVQGRREGGAVFIVEMTAAAAALPWAPRCITRAASGSDYHVCFSLCSSIVAVCINPREYA